MRKKRKRKTTKLQNMRVIEIPRFRAVSSGQQTLDALFGDASKYHAWVKEHPQFIKEHIYEPPDFVWHEDNDINKSVWIHAIRDEVTQADTAPYEIIEFPGGMFLLATADEKDNDDLEKTVSCMREWIDASGVFTYGDYPISGMCNMPNPGGAIDKALGIAQQQIYLPLKFKSNKGEEYA